MSAKLISARACIDRIIVLADGPRDAPALRDHLIENRSWVEDVIKEVLETNQALFEWRERKSRRGR